METHLQNFQKLKKNKEWRIQATQNNLGLFMGYYLPHYFKQTTPAFHFDIFNDLTNDKIKFLELIAFRGSGKSVISSLAFPLWCSVFKKKNFIILCSDTFTQAKLHIENIIHELEDNDLLKEDFGPFKGLNEWTATNIVLENDVRIISRSRGQKLRGLRHYESRPDLIICDDVENIEDVRTKEQRDKTAEWFFSDVLPALDNNGQIIVVGNLLHQDSLISRLKSRTQVLREYSLFDDKGKSVWPQEYTEERIKELKKNLYFQREYLLRPMVMEGQLIKKVDYYNQVPTDTLQRIAIGVDLAISKKEEADYTSINILAENEDGKMYNLKNIYGKWNFNEALSEIWTIYEQYQNLYPELPVLIGIEDVAYQKAAIEEFYRRHLIQPIPIKQTKDKRARVEMLLPYIENQQLLFKESGMEDLINQMLNFGVEKYDDCVDALEISVRLIITADRPMIERL